MDIENSKKRVIPKDLLPTGMSIPRVKLGIIIKIIQIKK